MDLDGQTFIYKAFQMFNSLQSFIELDLLYKKLVEDVIDWEIVSASL